MNADALQQNLDATNLGNNLNSNSLDNKRQRQDLLEISGEYKLPTNLTVPTAHSLLSVPIAHNTEYGDDVQSSSSVETCEFRVIDICLLPTNLTVPHSTLSIPVSTEYGDDVQSSSSCEFRVYTKFDIAQNTEDVLKESNDD